MRQVHHLVVKARTRTNIYLLSNFRKLPKTTITAPSSFSMGVFRIIYPYSIWYDIMPIINVFFEQSLADSTHFLKSLTLLKNASCSALLLMEANVAPGKTDLHFALASVQLWALMELRIIKIICVVTVSWDFFADCYVAFSDTFRKLI